MPTDMVQADAASRPVDAISAAYVENGCGLDLGSIGLDQLGAARARIS